MPFPLVSLVTPTFNQARYLADAIESVLAQSYRNIEYIVIDDGSTDGTAEILKRYDGRIKAINQSNMGQSYTLNRGWGMATGEIVGYLSSDDLLAPSAVEVCVDRLLAEPRPVAVYPDYSLIDQNGDLIRQVRVEDFQQSRLAEDLICQPGPGALFFKSHLENVGGWRTDLEQIADFEFWLRLSTRGTLRRVPIAVASWRSHEDSASVRHLNDKRCNEIVSVMRDYWRNGAQGRADRSIARAYIVSAATHFRSQHWLSGSSAFLRSVTYSPTTALSWSNLRCVAGGLARSVGIYRALKKVTPRFQKPSDSLVERADAQSS